MQNIISIEAEQQLRFIEAINTPNMKSGKRTELINRYLKAANLQAKSGTIGDRDRLKRILKKK